MAADTENIRTKKFTEKRNCYVKEEVDSYLENVDDEIKKNKDNIKNLELELNEAKSKLEDYYKVDKEIKNILLSLNEPIDISVSKAKEKADKIIEEAEEKRKEIIFNAEKEAKSTRNTLLFLKEQQEIFIARLKIIIDNQEGLLNEFNQGNNSASLKKSLAEAAAFEQKAELKIDGILEKLL